jgi:hypothetical protein
MNLNQSHDTQRTVIETPKTEDIADEALDRLPGTSETYCYNNPLSKGPVIAP